MSRIALLLLLGASTSLCAQEEVAASEPTLGELVASFLDEVDERQAKKLKKAITKRRPKVSEVTALLAEAPPAFESEFTFEVPFKGKAVRIQVACPPGHSVDSEPLPVVIQFRLRRIPDTVRVPGVINAWPLKFDPKLKSEDLRDGAIKFAHAVAWRAKGDPRRLWMSGFSHGAHATFDVALHRPHSFRGIVPMAGTLGRVDFRLLRNLEGHSVFAMCGTKDDREMIWNLRELERRKKTFGFDYFLGMDDRVQGRFIPSPLHVPKIGPHVSRLGPCVVPTSGVFVADERGVRSPRFEVLAVAPSATKVPRRIPVSTKLGPDEARRKIIDTTINQRAALRWEYRPDAKPLPELHLRAKGMTRAKLLWRRSWVGQPERLRVIIGEKGRRRDLRLKPSLTTILDDVRRTGRRHDPCLMDAPLRF